MSVRVLVIGVGNDFRCDDGVGPAVATAVGERHIVGVRAMSTDGEPGTLLDEWAGVPLVIAVDAAVGEDATPGRIRRWVPGDTATRGVMSSHKFGLAQTYSLGEALRRLPERLVVFTIDVRTIEHGVTLTPAVAAAVPRAVTAVLDEISCVRRQSAPPSPTTGPDVAPMP